MSGFNLIRGMSVEQRIEYFNSKMSKYYQDSFIFGETRWITPSGKFLNTYKFHVDLIEEFGYFYRDQFIELMVETGFIYVSSQVKTPDVSMMVKVITPSQRRILLDLIKSYGYTLWIESYLHKCFCATNVIEFNASTHDFPTVGFQRISLGDRIKSKELENSAEKIYIKHTPSDLINHVAIACVTQESD
jgi:hypothetical protein